MLEQNAFFLARAKGVGVVSRELAQDVGIAGPLLRGSGIAYDLRRNAPYSSYQDFDFRSRPRRTATASRATACGWSEFREAITIIRQALDKLPAGPISSRPALKSVAQIRIPKGESYARVEGPRGEVGCYIIADGSAKPYRMKWRGASFSNLVDPSAHHSRATRWPTSSPSWARSIPCSARWIGNDATRYRPG